MKKKVLAGVAVVTVALGFAVSPADAAVKTYTLAYQGPLTGDNAQTGIDEIAGVKYAIAKFNAAHKGSIQVKLVEADDQGGAAGAGQVAPGIAKNTAIIGLVGPAFSGASIASFPFYKAAGLTLISPSATRVTLTDPTVASDFGGPVFHRLPSKDDKQGPALAAYAIKGVTAPVVYDVNDQSSYGVGLSGYVQTALKANSKVKLAGADAVDGTNAALDLSAVITKIKGANANVVIYEGYYAQAASFVKQLRDAGYKGIFASGDGTYDPGFVTLAKDAAEGARLTASSAVFQDAGAKITADFTKVIGTAPGTYAVEDYDATNVFLTCITKGATTRAKMATCVKTGTFTGLFKNTIKFDANGDVSGTGFINGFLVKNGVIISAGQVK
jgi:branched-chain amino acid transport system substrate-binding protein